MVFCIDDPGCERAKLVALHGVMQFAKELEDEMERRVQ